jgi:hypothetical protein
MRLVATRINKHKHKHNRWILIQEMNLTVPKDALTLRVIMSVSACIVFMVGYCHDRKITLDSKSFCYISKWWWP